MPKKIRPSFPKPTLHQGRSVLPMKVNYKNMKLIKKKPKLKHTKTASYKLLLNPKKIILFKEAMLKNASLNGVFEKIALKMQGITSKSDVKSTNMRQDPNSSNFGYKSNYDQRITKMQGTGTKYKSPGSNKTRVKQNVRSV
jgi:hypothetical protein